MVASDADALIRPFPETGQAGHRRDQRRRRHRRLRGRAHLRLPRRVGARPLRRHARARRDHAGLGPHRAARRGDRPPPGTRDERHRQLPRRADRARRGAWSTTSSRTTSCCRSPASSRSTSRRTTPPACATCSRPTARRNGPPTTRPAASSCVVRRNGWRRRAASPTRWPSARERDHGARALAAGLSTWPSPRSGSRCPTPSSTTCAPAIARTRWPDEVDDAGWDYGTPLGYLQELVEYWADGFDWRRREQLLNSLPQFRTTVDAPGFDEFGLHFVHQPGVGPAPLPLVLSHGWPSTHYEYQDVVVRLAEPGRVRRRPRRRVPRRGAVAARATASPTSRRRRGMTPRVMATMFAALMRELGYDRFGAAGCDWGAYVTALLGLDHPDALVGIHMGMLNFRAARLRAHRRGRLRSARVPRRGGARNRATAPSRARNPSRSHTG